MTSAVQINRKISLLLPTRGRPHLVRRLFQSIVDNTNDLDDVEIIMCLDDDDTECHRIEDPRLNIIQLIGPRSTMGEYNTNCLNHSSGDVVILLNDDLTINTSGWDRIIADFVRTIPDGIFMAYPNDTECRGKMCTFPIMTRKTCEILSNPYPKEYEALYIDQHILDIFIRLKHLGKNRMFYLKNVIFQHKHFIDGGIRPDASYSHKKRFSDSMSFISLRHLRQFSAQRLLAAIEGHPLPKQPSQSFFNKPPSNLFQAFWIYFSVFLQDHGLPLKRRLILFIGFLKYYAAMKNGLSFLKRKSYEIYGSK